MNVSQKSRDIDKSEVVTRVDSQELHLPLNPHKSELLGWSVAVVKEELFTRLDVSLCKYSDPVISVHHQHLGATVGVDGMIGESDLVSFPCRVHHILVVQVEEEGTHVLVIHFAPPVCLVL